MKKLILLAGLSIIIFSCQPAPSKETIALEKELDSIKKYNVTYAKYLNHISDLMQSGTNSEEATEQVNKIYQESHPIVGAEWMK